jgi:hypothetical protein
LLTNFTAFETSKEGYVSFGGSQVLICMSNRANHKYHLREITEGLADTLKDLGAVTHLVILSSTLTPSDVVKLIKRSEYIFVNSEMTKTEIDFIVSLNENLGYYKKRICMFVYDMWRESDRQLIEQSRKYIHAFLHMDEPTVQRVFASNKAQFYRWPIARFWQKVKNTDALPIEDLEWKKLPHLFFSGSARQIDRREILDQIIKNLKNSRVRPIFHIFDTLNSRHIPSSQNYLTRLLQSESILSLSQKSSTAWIVTGRAIEILACTSGGVLLQQNGLNYDIFAGWLKPDVDYLQFRNSYELQEKLEFIVGCPAQLPLIASRGNDSIKKIFARSVLMEPFT